MNRPIVRLYGLVALLFALLVAFTSRWTIFEASSLRENPLNARTLLEQERIERGPILAADGTVLARSVRGPEGVYQRVYPTGELFAAADRLRLHRTRSRQHRPRALPQHGAERPERHEPAERARSAAGQGTAGREGDHDARPARAARRAVAALGEHEGAVVALDPRTGAVTRDGLHAELRPQRAALAGAQAPGRSAS